MSDKLWKALDSVAGVMMAVAMVAAVVVWFRHDAGKAAVMEERAKVAETKTAESVAKYETMADSVRLARAAAAVAEAAARDARTMAAAARSRAEMLAKRVTIVNDTTAVVNGDTATVPTALLDELVQLRITVSADARALAGDSIAMDRMAAEAATLRASIAKADVVIRDQAAQVTALKKIPVRWYEKVMRAGVVGAAGAGCGALGALAGGPGGAAAGAALCGAGVALALR